MRHLVDIVNEAADQKLIQQMIDILKQDGTTNDEVRIALDTIKFNRKTGLPTGKMVPGETKLKKDGTPSKSRVKMVPEIEPDVFKFGEWISRINVRDSTQKAIKNILISNSDMRHFIHYIQDPTFSSSNLLHDERNIYKLLKTTGISENTLRELANLEDTKNRISQGKGEILFKMFLKDLNLKSRDDHGDFECGTKSFEIKSKGARVGGQKSASYPFSTVYKTINKELAKRGIKFKLGSKSLCGVEETSETISKLYDALKSDYDLFNIIYDGLISQYGNNDELNKDDKQYLAQEIFHNGVIQYKDKENQLKRLMMAIQLYDYSRIEQFDYFVVIDIESGDFCCLDTQQFSIMNLFDNKKIGKHIKVDNGTGGNAGATTSDMFCCIEYKK